MCYMKQRNSSRLSTWHAQAEKDLRCMQQSHTTAVTSMTITSRRMIFKTCVLLIIIIGSNLCMFTMLPAQAPQISFVFVVFV